MDRAVAHVQLVAEGQRWCAMLIGSVGCGKTHLAIAALLSWHLNRKTGVFWKVPKMMPWLRGFVFSEDRGLFDSVMTSYGSPDFLLVLDDFGVHKSSEWADETLYRLIDERYENQAPTIITANVPLDAIDPRIVSRMRGGLVVCDAPDYRARQ